jgi:hypothetical protein
MRSLTSSVDNGFEFESQMTQPVTMWLRNQGLMVKCEFAVPWGICDLVAVRLDAKRIRQRLSYGQKRPIGSAMRLHVLSKIPDSRTGSSISLTKLRAELSSYVQPDVLSKQLSVLTRDRFVISPRRGCFQKLNGWAPLHHRIVAVELKLSRISEVLAQAESNYSFATESYVALPAKLAHRLLRSSRAEALKRTGIGLLAAYPDSCRRLLLPSANRLMFDDILQAHCVERFWRTRGN